jgi:hypothetical protein
MKKLKAKISFIIRLISILAPAVITGVATWHVCPLLAILAAIGAETLWLFLIAFVWAIRNNHAHKSRDVNDDTPEELGDVEG